MVEAEHAAQALKSRELTIMSVVVMARLILMASAPRCLEIVWFAHIDWFFSNPYIQYRLNVRSESPCLRKDFPRYLSKIEKGATLMHHIFDGEAEEKSRHFHVSDPAVGDNVNRIPCAFHEDAGSRRL